MIFTTKNKELAILGNTIDDIKNKIDKFNEIKIKNPDYIDVKFTELEK